PGRGGVPPLRPVRPDRRCAADRDRRRRPVRAAGAPWRAGPGDGRAPPAGVRAGGPAAGHRTPGRRRGAGAAARPPAGSRRRSRPGAGGRMTPLLECAGLDVAYGRTQILFGVSVDVAAGEVLAVLGTNGAGKSTLLRAISGLTPPKGGRLLLDGRDVTGTSPVKMAALGVAHMPGGRGIFPDLTVGENLRMATWSHRRDRTRSKRARQRALELFPGLSGRLDVRAGLLSGGQQQMLALAQALMAEPRLLLVDELSLGLAPVVVTELLDVVRRLRDDGVAIVLVEQSAELALRVADRAVFLEKGETRFSGPAQEILERGDLVRSVFLSGARDRAEAAATTIPGLD